MDSWSRNSWAQYRAEINHRLDAIRPDRSGNEDKDWREEVYGWARNHIPNESGIIRYFAEREVDRCEGNALKRGNSYIRNWAKGQIPLLWHDLGPLPITVGKVKVRFDVATADDVDDAARDQMVRAKATYDEVMILVLGMQDIARSARRQGLERVALLGDLEPRGNDDGVIGLLDEDPWDDTDEE